MLKMKLLILLLAFALVSVATVRAHEVENLSTGDPDQTKESSDKNLLLDEETTEAGQDTTSHEGDDDLKEGGADMHLQQPTSENEENGEVLAGQEREASMDESSDLDKRPDDTDILDNAEDEDTEEKRSA